MTQHDNESEVMISYDTTAWRWWRIRQGPLSRQGILFTLVEDFQVQRRYKKPMFDRMFAVTVLQSVFSRCFTMFHESRISDWSEKLLSLTSPPSGPGQSAGLNDFNHAIRVEKFHASHVVDDLSILIPWAPSNRWMWHDLKCYKEGLPRSSQPFSTWLWVAQAQPNS